MLKVQQILEQKTKKIENVGIEIIFFVSKIPVKLNTFCQIITLA